MQSATGQEMKQETVEVALTVVKKQETSPANSLFTGFDLVTAYRALIASYVRSEKQAEETMTTA